MGLLRGGSASIPLALDLSETSGRRTSEGATARGTVVGPRAQRDANNPFVKDDMQRAGSTQDTEGPAHVIFFLDESPGGQSV